MNTHCVIMDIDGTLANADHRIHLLLGEKKDWPAFLAAAPGDSVNEEIKILNNTLYQDNVIVICTGRNEKTRAETEKWLADNGISYDHLLMRPADDFSEDTIVKKAMLDQVRGEMGLVPLFAVEDRKKVAAMFRENGVRCLHVCEGDY